MVFFLSLIDTRFKNYTHFYKCIASLHVHAVGYSFLKQILLIESVYKQVIAWCGVCFVVNRQWKGTKRYISIIVS